MNHSIVFATNNKHKIEEVQHLLGDRFNLVSLSSLGHQEDIPENQATLEGNAVEKARFISHAYKTDCFADDTGLEIDALHGEPGVFSARYAGPAKDSKANMQKVLEKMKGVRNRKARFRTVIALVWKGTEYLFEGTVEGSIIESPRGTMGFGYDPIFMPDGGQETFAEMKLSDKNLISHRARATQKLVAFLLSTR